LVELNFTIDFTGSEDIVIENSEDFIISSMIQAECVETLAIVKEQPHSKLMWQVNWHKLEPPRERQLLYQAKAHAQLKSAIDRSKKVFKTYPLAESSLESIEQQLFENAFKSFVDPEFPPNDESLAKEKGEEFKAIVHWRRPTDFMHIDAHSSEHSEIKVFHKEVEPSDIKAGPLSFKWILCALATLAERPALVKRLFLTQEFK
jgi:Calpain family cysteine protease